MIEPFMAASSFLLLLVGIMVAVLLRRKVAIDLSPVITRQETSDRNQERLERTLREEIVQVRSELAEQGRGLRDELGTSLKNSTDLLVNSVGRISEAQARLLGDFAVQLSALTQTSDTRSSQLRLEVASAMDAIKEETAVNRRDSSEQSRSLREEVQTSLKASADALVQSVDRISHAQQKRLEDFASQLSSLANASDAAASTLRGELNGALFSAKESQERSLANNVAELQRHSVILGQRLSEFSQAIQDAATHARAEQSKTLKDFQDSLQQQMTDSMRLQSSQMASFGSQIAELIDRNDKRSEELRAAVEGRLTQLQSENTVKLEEMRRTVDEKLQSTLERRLGESFKQVSDQLEQVHRGIGEMQALALGVGDLKRVLTNVKTRGTWGEVQLGNLLGQILTADQYSSNVRTNPSSRETVDFAIRLPGRSDEEGSVVWLPIDAKFPKEDYERIVEASERGDAAGVEQGAKELELRVRSQARDVRNKYISPPHTTDFGLLYLPTEGLYAEVIRRPGLMDSLQRDCRVVIVGPTTLSALLNSLQMGFRTLAIQKKSSEVWKVLGAVKTEFGSFGDALAKVKRKLDETGNTIDEAVHRSRQMERKLKLVEALPAEDAARVLSGAEFSGSDDEDPDGTAASEATAAALVELPPQPGPL